MPTNGPTPPQRLGRKHWRAAAALALACAGVAWVGYAWNRGAYIEVKNYTDAPLTDVRLRFGELRAGASEKLLGPKEFSRVFTGGGDDARFPRIEPGRSAGVFVPRTTSVISFVYTKPDGTSDGAINAAGFPPLSDLLLEPVVQIQLTRKSFGFRRRSIYDPAILFDR